MNRASRRRTILAEHGYASLRAVAWWRAERRAGREHCIPSGIAPLLDDVPIVATHREAT